MGNTLSNDIFLKDNLKFKIITDKEDASKNLISAEKIDMYLEECMDSHSNSLARKQLTYAPNSISLQDLNYGTTFLQTIIPSIPLRLKNELEEVKIIHLMPTADGGMPHTRPGDIICYPNFSQVFSRTTLIHELWHIHQRKYKDIWFKTFKQMGWLMWDGTLPEQLEKNRRYNPDTIDCPLWIFGGNWVPVPIFKDITRPNVSEVEIWFYNPDRRYHSRTIPTEISEYYPNLPSSAYEHPREITAYMLSEPDKYRISRGFKDLISSIGEISISNA